MKKNIVLVVLLISLMMITACGKQEETAVVSTEVTTKVTTTEVTTEITTATTTEATTEGSKEPTTTEYGDKVEYIDNEYGTISRYTIKRDGMDQVEDILDFETPIEVVNNDYVTIYIMQVTYNHTASGEVYVAFWYTAKNNSDSEYIDLLTMNESVGEQMINFPHVSGGGMIAPGKKSEWFGQETDALSEDTITSVEDMINLEGTFQCTFYKDTNSYSDRDEKYDFSLKESLSSKTSE